MNTLQKFHHQKSFQLTSLFICLLLQCNLCHAVVNKVGASLFATTETVCCPPDKTSGYPIGSLSCNTLAWSSIDTVINNGAPVSNFKLQNAILLPPGFPKPDFVYVTNINGGQREEPLIIINTTPSTTTKTEVFFSESSSVADSATLYANYVTPTSYVWKGYESNGFILPSGVTVYRLVYFWAPPTPLPCRYFPGRLWNSDNTISGFSSNSVTTPLNSQGLLICKKNIKCDDPTGGAISVVPKCSTPYPLGPSNPYYVLKTASTVDTNTTGTFINLNPGAFTVSLIDSVTNIATDSNEFNITLSDLYLNDSNVTACGSYTWYGNTYTTSGIYTHTDVGVYPSPTSSACNVVSTLVLEVNELNTFVTSIVTPLGSSVTISATGASSYSWMPGALTGSSITVSPTASTTYTVTGTSPGCTQTATRLVNVVGPTAGTSMHYIVKDLQQINSNTFTYNVYCKNTGSTTLALRGYSFGLNHQAGLDNGGIITHSFISRDALFSALPPVIAGYTSASNHLRVTTINATAGNEVLLTSNVEYLLATMQVQTSALSFPNNFNPFANIIPLEGIQVLTTPGRTQCVANTFVNANTGALQSLHSLIGTGNSPTAFQLNVLTAVMEPSPLGIDPFILNPPFTTITLGAIIQGYWDGAGEMLPVLSNQLQANPITDCDSITVELRDPNLPHGMLYSTQTVLKTNGIATCVFPLAVIGGSYYVAIKHRNAIQTWSSTPVSVVGATSYDFTSAASQAFGSNQVEVSPGIWALYSGDAVNDDNLDLLDIGSIESDAANFLFGYYATDITGDGNVDLLDTPIAELNAATFVFSIHP